MRSIPAAPDSKELALVLKQSLKRGSLTKTAKYLEISRQVFTKKFIRVLAMFLFFLRTLAWIDPCGFERIIAFINSQCAKWTRQTGPGVPEETLVELLNLQAEVIRLRNKRGTRHEQLITAMQLQVKASELVARLSETPEQSDTGPLKMARASRSRVDKAYAEVERQAVKLGIRNVA
jgi:hypothetical protein